MNTNEQGFPVQGDITSIDQLERVQDYIDNKILDSLGWIANSLDRLQLGLTFATGSILKNAGNRIKKELQKNGRVISRIQKAVDYQNFDNVIKSSIDVNPVEEAMQTAPLEIEQIDSGIIPAQATVEKTLPIDVSNGIDVITEPPPLCTEDSIRINPDTCEIESCVGGQWGGIGIFNQACLDAKHGGNPPPPPPPPDGCSWEPPSGTNILWGKVTAQVCANQAFPVNAQLLFGTDTLDRLHEMFPVTNDRYWNKLTASWNYQDHEQNVFATNNQKIPVIATTTLSRSNYYNISPWTEDGQYAIHNKFMQGIIPDNLETYTDYNVYMQAAMSSPATVASDVEIGYLTVSDEWGV